MISRVHLFTKKKRLMTYSNCFESFSSVNCRFIMVIRVNFNISSCQSSSQYPKHVILLLWEVKSFIVGTLF